MKIKVIDVGGIVLREGFASRPPSPDDPVVVGADVLRAKRVVTEFKEGRLTATVTV